MPAPQSASNHARWYPLYHFVVSPILTLTFFGTVWVLVRDPSWQAAWHAVLAFALAGTAFTARIMALTVQDRVIRLEETLRMTRLLPADLQAQIGKLRRRHFIALRFASDEELPDLVRRVAAGELDQQKEIKQAIRTWRPDYLRA